jgi:hypothetical protein
MVRPLSQFRTVESAIPKRDATSTVLRPWFSRNCRIFMPKILHDTIDLRDRPSADLLRVLAIGSPPVVDSFVMSLFQLGYARPDEWSRQLPTINPGEVMRILTKRILLT